MLLRLLPQTSLLLCFCSRVLSRGLCRSGRSSTSVPFSSISWPCPLLRQPKALIMTDDCSLSNLFPPFLFRSSALEGCLPYRSLCSHNAAVRGLVQHSVSSAGVVTKPSASYLSDVKLCACRPSPTLNAKPSTSSLLLRSFAFTYSG